MGHRREVATRGQASLFSWSHYGEHSQHYSLQGLMDDNTSISLMVAFHAPEPGDKTVAVIKSPTASTTEFRESKCKAVMAHEYRNTRKNTMRLPVNQKTWNDIRDAPACMHYELRILLDLFSSDARESSDLKEAIHSTSGGTHRSLDPGRGIISGNGILYSPLTKPEEYDRENCEFHDIAQRVLV
eukprot:GHVU01102239.1.p1 GENE.GHVU01102239.1~~GHVU01102239.1.p1  ORF type:complete len:185 (+),score=6.93 GHVU01102239.1:235-789(+)